MQNLNELIPSEKQHLIDTGRRQKTSSSPLALMETGYVTAMTKLWGELIELYGTKAEVKYGPVGGAVFESWCKKLQHLKPDDVIRGLEACIYREEEWPPEQQEFMRLCLSVKPVAAHREFKRDQKLLTAQKASRVTADEHRKKLKQILKSST